MKTRSEIAHEEMTRDPIFLLQVRMVIPNQDCQEDYNYTEESYWNPDTGELFDDDDLLKNGWAAQVWRTISVFLTREEGESFAEQRSYRYGKGRKNIDWMVYCIPCEGDLAKLLKNQISQELEDQILGLLRLHGVFYESLDSIVGGMDKILVEKEA